MQCKRRNTNLQHYLKTFTKTCERFESIYTHSWKNIKVSQFFFFSKKTHWYTKIHLQFLYTEGSWIDLNFSFFLFWDGRRLDCSNSNHWSGILLHCRPEHKAHHILEKYVSLEISWQMPWKILFYSVSWRNQRDWTSDFNFFFVSCWCLRKCIVSKRPSQ